MELKPRQKLGNYIVGLKIGDGEFGFVYMARPIGDPTRKIAIKGTYDELLFENLLEEMVILRTLHHNNIIQIYEFHHFENEPGGFIVMELMESDLGKQIEELSFYEKLMVIKQTLRGLIYIHNLDLIHRDIKPQNLLLNKKSELELKISDFGLSKPASKIADYEVGTYPYIAPEIKEGKIIDHRCDIYSLAVVMEDLFKEDVPKPLLEMIKKGKSRNPNKRFKNCIEMLQVLGEIAETPEIRRFIEPKQQPLQISKKTIESFLDAKHSFRTKTKIKKLKQLIESHAFFKNSYQAYTELGVIYAENQNFEEAVNNLKDAYYSQNIPRSLKIKLNLLIAYSYSNLEKEKEAQYFCEKYNNLSGKKLDLGSNLENLAKETLWKVSIENERSFEQLRIHK
jgi:serine/threonine protein kinase